MFDHLRGGRSMSVWIVTSSRPNRAIAWPSSLLSASLGPVHFPLDLQQLSSLQRWNSLEACVCLANAQYAGEEPPRCSIWTFLSNPRCCIESVKSRTFCTHECIPEKHEMNIQVRDMWRHFKHHDLKLNGKDGPNVLKMHSKAHWKEAAKLSADNDK